MPGERAAAGRAGGRLDAGAVGGRRARALDPATTAATPLMQAVGGRRKRCGASAVGGRRKRCGASVGVGVEVAVAVVVVAVVVLP